MQRYGKFLVVRKIYNSGAGTGGRGGGSIACEIVRIISPPGARKNLRVLFRNIERIIII